MVRKKERGGGAGRGGKGDGGEGETRAHYEKPTKYGLGQNGIACFDDLISSSVILVRYFQ